MEGLNRENTSNMDDDGNMETKVKKNQIEET
jgi:hypothetical protein